MQRSENATTPCAVRIPMSLIGFGLGLAFVVLCEIALLVSTDSALVTDGEFLVGVVTSAPFLVGITYAGYWLRSGALSSDRYPRIGWWCLGGLATFLLVNLALIAVTQTESRAMVFSWIRWAVAFGAGTGLLVGCIEGRAIDRALTAERAALRAEHVEEQREYLSYLNSILRHEVLNAATIINGYASRLLAEGSLDERNREWLEIVIDESEDMSTVIDDVRVLLQTTERNYRPEPVDAAHVVADEIRKLETTFDSVVVEASIPERAVVRADDLLARIFANLLSNAVEHNDAATPRVSVTVDPGPDTVRFEIADNGPGIPDSELESLFDRVESRGSTHGLGLYLVRRLTARYDGTVELAETGPEGSRFAVELPAASSDGDAEPLESENTSATARTASTQSL
ncbi:HAMP domain-containing sensor histidine kinase [Natrinema versiforme]|uniref:GHKL domain-containing protein n=1 Tax=Natrinema versiforme TaxID=88724 RepID=A0A4P8WLE8_9EURY|nr:HAMP domain-containing sensor histidine kinase [Natrinema versiforme]QCS44165.1 GHKL domain-containing protein [Natrinema versiforme]